MMAAECKLGAFGYFVRSVETRVGPQRARISLQQAFPWPTRLTAGSDAASGRGTARAQKLASPSIGLEAEAYRRRGMRPAP